MRRLWADEALDDLAEVVAYYHAAASPRTAESVERRIIEQIKPSQPSPRPDRALHCFRNTLHP